VFAQHERSFSIGNFEKKSKSRNFLLNKPYISSLSYSGYKPLANGVMTRTNGKSQVGFM
jgi:hypothetical protein